MIDQNASMTRGPGDSVVDVMVVRRGDHENRFYPVEPAGDIRWTGPGADPFDLPTVVLREGRTHQQDTGFHAECSGSAYAHGTTTEHEHAGTLEVVMERDHTHPSCRRA